MADRRLVPALVVGLLLALVVGVFLFETGAIYYVSPPNPDSYERTTITAVDANGTELATVRVRIADTRAKRWLGLSDTADLSMGEGMLFVHSGVENRSYVMRDMAFPLDIIFIDADGRVRTIRHASVPDGDADRRYSGRGKWILEVPRGWSNETGLDTGDRVIVPAEARNASG